MYGLNNATQIIMDLLTEAKRNNLRLWVTITVRKEQKSFKMTAKEVRKAIKRYETYYNCIKIAESYNDYEHTIRFTKNIQFHIILY